MTKKMNIRKLRVPKVYSSYSIVIPTNPSFAAAASKRVAPLVSSKKVNVTKRLFYPISPFT